MIRYYVTDCRSGDVLDCAARAIRDEVDLIQVREKDLPAHALLDLVTKIRDLAAGTKTQILVNDRLDISLATRVAGVHLPGKGLPAVRVRPLVNLLGVSVHSAEEAIEAERAGADFAVFGPVFDTPGKTAVGLEPLRQVVLSVKMPILAIGGVTMANADEVLRAGAAGIAGIRLFQSPPDRA